MSGLADYLDKVRAKPEAERRRLLWIWTITLTLLIVLVWLLNLYITGVWNFGGGGVGEPSAPATESSWSSAWRGIKEGWSVITTKVYNFNK